MNRAVFLDRDGVINKLPENFPHNGEGDRRNYVTAWSDFEWEDGVFEAFRLIKKTDYLPIVVSNQAVIGYGLASGGQIGQIFSAMEDVIEVETGLSLDSYFCPHHPNDNCACRKPKPGMIYQAAVEYEIDLSKSWMIGDMPSDMIAADMAGIPQSNRIQIGKSGGVYATVTGWTKDSLLDAVNHIMELE